MKKVLFLFVILFSFVDLYAFSIFGSKLDGFWVPEIDLMMRQEINQKNEELNDQFLGKFTRKLVSSIVLYIDGESATVFWLGSRAKATIQKIDKDTFKIKEMEFKYQKFNDGKEFLAIVDNNMMIIFEKFE